MSKAPPGLSKAVVWDELTETQKMAVAGEEAGRVGQTTGHVVVKRAGRSRRREKRKVKARARARARGKGEAVVATQTGDEGWWSWVWRRLVEWVFG